MGTWVTGVSVGALVVSFLGDLCVTSCAFVSFLNWKQDRCTPIVVPRDGVHRDRCGTRPLSGANVGHGGAVVDDAGGAAPGSGV